MNEETFITIMESSGIADSAIIHEAYQAIKHALDAEKQLTAECEAQLTRQIDKLIKGILGFRIAFDTPFFVYQNYLKKKNKKNPNVYFDQFAKHIHIYASLIECKLSEWAQVKIIDNDIKVIPTGKHIYGEAKRMASIASDIMSNCIYSDIQYEARTGQFVATVNIIDGEFFARHGIDCFLGEPDSRKAIFSGVLKRKKIMFNLKINCEEIFTEFEIDRKLDKGDKAVGQILRDSIIQFSSTLNKGK